VRAQAPAVPLKDQVALAEKQVAVKRAALKVADAQKGIAEAKLKVQKTKIASAQTLVNLAKAVVERMRDLAKSAAVSEKMVREAETKMQSALDSVVEVEALTLVSAAEVTLETARRELAAAELDEAELRLQLLQARLKAK
jgi:multidrug resistance efflux pump